MWPRAASLARVSCRPGPDPWPDWQRPAAAAAAIFGTGSSAPVAKVRRSAAALAADGIVDLSWRAVFKGLERRGDRLHLVRLKPTEAEQAAEDAARAAGFREIVAEIERATGERLRGSV
jgi:hypothetical protein